MASVANAGARRSRTGAIALCAGTLREPGFAGPTASGTASRWMRRCIFVEKLLATRSEIKTMTTNSQCSAMKTFGSNAEDPHGATPPAGFPFLARSANGVCPRMTSGARIVNLRQRHRPRLVSLSGNVWQLTTGDNGRKCPKFVRFRLKAAMGKNLPLPDKAEAREKCYTLGSTREERNEVASQNPWFLGIRVKLPLSPSGRWRFFFPFFSQKKETKPKRESFRKKPRGSFCFSMNANQIQKELLLTFWGYYGGWKARLDVSKYRKHKKLGHLIAMSIVVMPYKKQLPLTERRADFDTRKQKLCRQKIGSPCFACSEPGFSRHHIIQLQNGGINSRRNLVILCDSCHATIHPWLNRSQAQSAASPT
jgi:hypothetical protein